MNMSEYKNYFVLVELEDYDNYPVLIRIKDYAVFKNLSTDLTSQQLCKILEERGYKKLVSRKNVILYSPQFTIS